MNSTQPEASNAPAPIAGAAPRLNLMDHDEAGLRQLFTDIGEKPFRATQVLKWIHQRRVMNFDDMTNLSKDLRAKLAANAYIPVPTQVTEQVSVDGTRKWALSVDSINNIETVFIPEAERGTLCVSSQVGCALDCKFCSTAQQGFNRNLGTAEIIGQLWFATNRLAELEAAGEKPGRITNVVFMGMGEPLLNFDNVVRAIHIMLDDNAYGLSRRRVTVSTAGVVPRILDLRDACGAALAISLHATTDEIRDEIVPVNRKYPLKQLLETCEDFLEGRQSGDHITFEYVMLDGVNDSLEDARRLAKLLNTRSAKVNLIPWNPFPGAPFARSPAQRISAFQRVLQEKGFVTTIRKTRGDDIDAACGQLVGKVAAKGKKHRDAKAARAVNS